MFKELILSVSCYFPATCTADRRTGLFGLNAVCTLISLKRLNTSPVGLNINQVSLKNFPVSLFTVYGSVITGQPPYVFVV